MTSEVVFDTWALWEVILGSPVGVALEKRHSGRIHCSTWALGELMAKMRAIGETRAEDVVQEVRRKTTPHPVTAEIAVEGGRLRSELRKSAPRASLGDGVMLATARSLGMKLISGDEAFKGQKDGMSA